MFFMGKLKNLRKDIVYRWVAGESLTHIANDMGISRQAIDYDKRAYADVWDVLEDNAERDHLKIVMGRISILRNTPDYFSDSTPAAYSMCQEILIHAEKELVPLLKRRLKRIREKV